MSEQYLPITSWAEDDRPREKLLQKGVPTLSHNELLAILLRSGGDKESALDLARRIMMDCGNNLNRLAELGVRDLMNRYKGIGMAKAASIVAAMELGRRRRPAAAESLASVHSSTDVYHYLQPFLADLDHEEFWVIFLTHTNKIKGSERLFSGGMDGTMIDLRILFRKALDIKASHIVVAHNHPGGNPVPSSCDEAITRKIREAGDLLGIVLYDHLIVGHDTYYSFLDQDKM